MTSSHPLPAPC
jgi:DDE superfamily endonuclease